jgi:hypothetical protein
MLDATTSLATGCRVSASRSTAVPTVFVELYSSTWYMLCPTPTFAAKWNTVSTP